MAANDQEIWVSAFDVLIAQLDEALIELRRSLASVAIEHGVDSPQVAGVRAQIDEATAKREKLRFYESLRPLFPSLRRAIEAVIVPRARDLGGFEVRRALPSARPGRRQARETSNLRFARSARARPANGPTGRR